MQSISSDSDKKYSLQGCTKNGDTISLISGDELVVNPTGVSMSQNIVSLSWNEINGHFNDIPMANKAKIVWRFEAAENFSEVENIMSKVYYNLKTYGTRFYKIKTWLPGLGWQYGYFYLGTPLNIDSEGVRPKEAGVSAGTAAIPKFEMHWIEIGDSTTDLPNSITS